MSAPITQHLNEQLRDAMLAFYMNTVLPEDPTVQTLQLADTFKHVDDIYAYWLLDPRSATRCPPPASPVRLPAFSSTSTPSTWAWNAATKKQA